jgi:hypothetical protein
MVRWCHSPDAWEDAFGGYVEQRVNVGEFCSRLEFDGPCETCELDPAAHRFVPDSFTWFLPPDGRMEDDLEVQGRVGLGCYLLSECGWPDFPDASCFGGIGATPPWVTATYRSSDGPSRHYFDLEIDAAGLAAGSTHVGEIYADAGCPTCVPVCMDVRLIVAETSSINEGEWVPALELEIRPNPAISTMLCTVTLEATSRVRVDLFDSTGRLVDVLFDAEPGTGSHWIRYEPGENLPAGSYFVRAVAGTHSVQKRLVIAPR